MIDDKESFKKECKRFLLELHPTLGKMINYDNFVSYTSFGLFTINAAIQCDMTKEEFLESIALLYDSVERKTPSEN